MLSWKTFSVPPDGDGVSNVTIQERKPVDNVPSVGVVGSHFGLVIAGVELKTFIETLEFGAASRSLITDCDVSPFGVSRQEQQEIRVGPAKT